MIKPLTIAGIGASAGMLPPLKKFFQSLPEDTGIVFVIVVHLSVDYNSRLAPILQRETTMPVQQVLRDVSIRPNHVYVIPPGANINAIDTHLRISRLEENRKDRAPIDNFFRTLANVHKGYSIGIIFSGTGSDGMLGSIAIKSNNGIILVQQPEEADFDTMPMRTISANVADKVLPVEDMAHQLLEIVKAHQQNFKRKATRQAKPDKEIIQKIIREVSIRTSHNLQKYNHDYLYQKIARRMVVKQLDQLEAYVPVVAHQQKEADNLVNDLHLKSSIFFQDQSFYQLLQDEIVPYLLDSGKITGKIRVWVAGCGTGEEVYSLAMLLAEEARRRDRQYDIKIFASEEDTELIKIARRGNYPTAIEKMINSDRLSWFFHPASNGYLVNHLLRDQVVFCHHELFNDPPFHQLDLVICHNILNRYREEVRQAIVRHFHFGLKAQAFLCLQPNLALDSSGFSVYKTGKRFSAFKKQTFQAVTYDFGHTPVRPEGADRHKALDIAFVHLQMLKDFGPASLLLNDSLGVVHSSGDLNPYLVFSGGVVTQNVLQMIRPELKPALLELLEIKEKNLVVAHSEPLFVQYENKPLQVSITIRQVYQEGNTYYMLLFHTQEADDHLTIRNRIVIDEKEFEIIKNGSQLKDQQLKTLTEKHWAGKEELLSANEELKTNNEHLLLLNEQLKEKQEALQRLNDKLKLANQEKSENIAELHRLKFHLDNLLNATDTAILILNQNLIVQMFTAALKNIFSITQSDLGKPIDQVSHDLKYDNLIEDVNRVLKSQVKMEKKVADKHPNRYLLKILPYEKDEGERGVILNFVGLV